jgi:CheY-like chemotaxis protein
MNTKTALVVDDSKSARFAMRKYLEGFGYQVDTAECAEDAYVYLRKRLPEVLFLDHIMPGTDGFDAIRAIKQNPLTAGLPVVLCSSNEGDDFRRQARICGAIDVLQKPPSPEQLRNVLDNIKRLQAATPPAALAPAAPNKVQPIREPGVAIEQAVMKSLRDALPPAVLPAATVRPAAPREEIATARGTPLREPARDEGMPRFEALREDMEARLRKITQDLFVQIAELKAQLTHIEATAQSSREEQRLQTVAARAIEPQLDALGRNFDTLLNRLRSDMDDRGVAAARAQAGRRAPRAVSSPAVTASPPRN